MKFPVEAKFKQWDKVIFIHKLVDPKPLSLLACIKSDSGSLAGSFYYRARGVSFALWENDLILASVYFSTVMKALRGQK